MFDKKYLTSSSVIFVNTLHLILIPQLNSNITNIGRVELGIIHGSDNYNKINIDKINNASGYILRCLANYIEGTLPTTVLLGGNGFLLIGFSDMTNQKLTYGVQMAIGFSSSKIAIRNANYNASGSVWSEWRAI